MKTRLGARFDHIRLVALWLGPAFCLGACEPAPVAPDPAAPVADASVAGRADGGGMAGAGGVAGGSGREGTGGVAPGSGGRGGQGGNGAAPPDAGTTPPAPDALAPARDTGPLPEGGTQPSAALDQRCTVPITFRNQSMGNEGGMVFQASIPDVTMAMQAHARAICRILYRKPEEVKNITQQGLTVEPHTLIAFASGSNITFSTNYIANFARGKNKAAIDSELNGVLVHEGTHVWQYTNGGGALVEAMADYVRFKAGYYTLARRRPGGNWNQPYTTGGFFIAWMEERYDPDLGYKLNMGMKQRGFSYPAFVQQITGKNVDAVWAEYQAAIR